MHNTRTQLAGGGNLYVLSAPSGTGKTSLVWSLREQDDHIQISISHTTRPPRADEENSQCYHFVDQDTFLRMREEKQFLECAEVFGNHYGTSRQWVENQLQARQDILLEIDWQGARQVRAVYPDCISIFVLPPHQEVLRQRLQMRGGEQHDMEPRLLQDTDREIAHYQEYDYILINDDFSRAVQELYAIVLAHRLHYPSHKQGYDQFVSTLKASVSNTG